MRELLKGIFERLLLHGGPAAISSLRVRGRSLVLAYHNVVPDDLEGTGDASLHLPLASFKAQLKALSECVEIVPLDRLLAPGPVADDNAAAPLVAITFDDAYRGAVTLALPEISRRGMSATLFVSPGRLGDESFWWDRYAAEAAASSEPDFRGVALSRHRGLDADISAWALEQDWRGSELPAALRTADEHELAEAARLPGITLASHAWSHPNLTCLEDDELRDELIRPLEWLSSRFDDPPKWIAYPYGLADERVAAAARTCGYEAGCRIEGGWFPRQRGALNRFMLPRLNIPAGISDAGFRCRLAGLL